MSNLGPVSELGKQRQNTITSFLSKPATKHAQNPTESGATSKPAQKLTESGASSKRAQNLTESGASSTGQEPDGSSRSIVVGENEITAGQDVPLDIDTRKQSTMSNVDKENGAGLQSDKGLHKRMNRVTEPVICPVCGRPIKTTRMELIHEHINFCLEKGSGATESIGEHSECLSNMTDCPISNKADEPICNMANEPICNKADEPICNMANEPICNKADEPICNMANEPICNKADQPMSKMTDQAVSNRTNQTVSNMANGPLSNRADKHVSYMAISDTREQPRPDIATNEPPVSNVTFPGYSHIIESEEPSVETCDLKDSSAIFSRPLDSCDRSVNSDKNAMCDDSFSSAINENPGYYNKELGKNQDFNCYNSTACYDKYTANTSSKFGITYIPLFTACPDKDQGNSECTKRSNTPVKDPQDTLAETSAFTGEVQLKTSPVSSSKVNQNQNSSPGQTCAVKSPLKLSPIRGKQGTINFSQIKPNDFKERSVTSEGILQGGVIEQDLKSVCSKTTTRNDPPKKEISIHVRSHNKDTGQRNAEHNTVSATVEATLALDSPSASMLTARDSDTKSLANKTQPSTVDKNCFVPQLNEIKHAAVAFPLDNSHVISSRQSKESVATSEVISRSASKSLKSRKSDDTSPKGQSKGNLSTDEFDVVANYPQPTSNPSIAKTAVFSSTNESENERSILGHGFGADPTFSPSTSSKTADPVTESGSIQDQASSSVKSMFTCPVCDMKVSATLAFFNKHLDSCLSKQTIKDMVGNNNNKIVRSPVNSNRKNASTSKLKNPKDAKRRRKDSGQKSMASFLTSSK